MLGNLYNTFLIHDNIYKIREQKINDILCDESFVIKIPGLSQIGCRMEPSFLGFNDFMMSFNAILFELFTSLTYNRLRTYVQLSAITLQLIL